jgi:F-type H+-transporting ATPase subunit b
MISLLLKADYPMLGPITLDSSFFAFLGLLIFLGIVWAVGVPKMVTKALDDRAATIAREIAEAERLRREAEALLASIDAKRIAAEAEAKALVENARAEAVHLKAEAEKALAEQIARRSAAAQARIARAEEQATRDIRAIAADVAAKAAELVLVKKLDAGAQEKLFETGLSEMGKRFS